MRFNLAAAAAAAAFATDSTASRRLSDLAQRARHVVCPPNRQPFCLLLFGQRTNTQSRRPKATIIRPAGLPARSYRCSSAEFRWRQLSVESRRRRCLSRSAHCAQLALSARLATRAASQPLVSQVVNKPEREREREKQPACLSAFSGFESIKSPLSGAKLARGRHKHNNDNNKRPLLR